MSRMPPDRDDAGWSNGGTTPSAAAAFSLVELLVVIAIIAILAALLLPALSRAKQESYVAVCQSNLHQIGIALVSYTGDFSAYPLWDAVPPGQAQILWHDPLAPYTHAKWTTNLGAGLADSTSQLYLCPAYPQAAGSIPLWPPGLDGWYRYGSYGYNAWGINDTNGGLGLGGELVNGANGPPTKAADIVSPSHMIAIADADFIAYWNAPVGPYIPGAIAGWSCNLGFIGEVGVWCERSTPGTGFQTCYNAEEARHNGGRRNVVFCDGHVEFLQPFQLYNYTNLEVLRLWNRDDQPHQNMIVPPP